MTSLRLLTAGCAAIAAALLFAPSPALAASPKTDPLAKAVAKGADLFATGTFWGSNNMTCESCHQGGGKIKGRLPNGKVLPSLTNAAAIFPRISHGKVITLAGQIRHCVRAGLGGNAPAYNSSDMVAMLAYLGSIAHGQPVDIGGKKR
jgi:thiosulfate dehydrogenase